MSYLKRKQMINSMQESLKDIRQLFGINTQEFSEIVGISRQTIYNLENNKAEMSELQFRSIAAVLDAKSEIDSEFEKELADINTMGPILNGYQNGPKKIIDRMLSTFPLRYGISKYASNGISEDDIFKDYICIINEDFLLNPNAEEFFEKYESYIRDNKSVLIVPSIVVDELNRQARALRGEERQEIGKVLKMLKSAYEKGLISVRGGDEENYKTVESLILSVIAMYRVSNKMAVFTADEDLIEDILSCNNHKTLEEYNQVAVCSLNEFGELEVLETKYETFEGEDDIEEFEYFHYDIKDDYLAEISESDVMNCESVLKDLSKTEEERAIASDKPYDTEEFKDENDILSSLLNSNQNIDDELYSLIKGWERLY